jgi:hypothetical protein
LTPLLSDSEASLGRNAQAHLMLNEIIFSIWRTEPASLELSIEIFYAVLHTSSPWQTDCGKLQLQLLDYGGGFFKLRSA